MILCCIFVLCISFSFSFFHLEKFWTYLVKRGHNLHNGVQVFWSSLLDDIYRILWVGRYDVIFDFNSLTMMGTEYACALTLFFFSILKYFIKAPHLTQTPHLTQNLINPYAFGFARCFLYKDLLKSSSIIFMAVFMHMLSVLGGRSGLLNMIGSQQVENTVLHFATGITKRDDYYILL